MRCKNCDGSRWLYYHVRFGDGLLLARLLLHGQGTCSSPYQPPPPGKMLQAEIGNL